MVWISATGMLVVAVVVTAPRSPVADDYRTKISTAVSDTDAALASIAADLTSAENAIINDGLEKVDPDSEEAKWPNK